MITDPLKSPKIKALAESIKRHTLEIDNIRSAIDKAESELHAAITHCGETENAIRDKTRELSTIEALENLSRATDQQLRHKSTIEDAIQKLADKDLKPAQFTVSKSTGKLEALKAMLADEVQLFDEATLSLPQAYKDYYLDQADKLLSKYTGMALEIVDLVTDLAVLDNLADGGVLHYQSGFLLPVPIPAKHYKQVEDKTPFYEAVTHINPTFHAYHQTIKARINKAMESA